MDIAATFIQKLCFPMHLPLANLVRSTSCHYFTSQGNRRNAIPSRAGVRRTKMLPHVGDLLTHTIILPCFTAVKTAPSGGDLQTIPI
jgi:hypothetical protein